MLYNRVINGELCFSAKEVFNVYELFHQARAHIRECIICTSFCVYARLPWRWCLWGGQCSD